ncbi:hypothetical protein D3C76_1271670 [compost metagenome]
MVGLLPTIDELRFHPHRLAGDHVLDLAHLVVTLIAADNFLEHSPELAALPGVEAALQLRLTYDCGVLAIERTKYISEQKALT